jgi:hypothetical protein
MAVADPRPALPIPERKSDEPTSRVAILFVHGIGEQLQGQTLVRFADPLARWFSRWLSEGQYVEPGAWAEGPVSVSLTELTPGDDGQAQARMRIDDPPQEWLLVESWWAETFRAPKASVVLLWLLAILPLMLLEQFFAPLQRSWNMRKERRSRFRSRFVPFAFRLVAFVLLFVASLPLAGIALLVVLLLLVPLLIPIERVRDMAKNLALKLANTLGDSFMLSSSPVQFDSMVRRVARDLASLGAGKVERLVVVAHSQGAALAYEAMRRYGVPANLVRFVTVGQALTKLQRVRELRRTPRHFRYVVAWAGVVSFYVFVVFGVRLGILAATSSGARHPSWLIADDVLTCVGFAGAAIVLFEVRSIVGDASEWRPKALERPNAGAVKWLNFYASADPVPNGPFFGKSERELWMTETEVWNHASVITDHTSYVNAQDDFVAELAVALLEVSGSAAATEELRAGIQATLWRRWWRVWWLSWMRVLAIVGAIAGVVSIKLQGHLHNVANLLSFVRGGVHYASLPLRSAFGLSDKVVSDATLAGVVLIAVVVAAGYVLLVGIWHLWDAHEVTCFFSRKRTQPLGGFPLGALFTTLCFVSTAAGFVVYFGDYPETWHSLVHPWLWSLVSLPAAALVSFVVLGLCANWIERWLRRAVEGNAVSGRVR